MAPRSLSRPTVPIMREGAREKIATIGAVIASCERLHRCLIPLHVDRACRPEQQGLDDDGWASRTIPRFAAGRGARGDVAEDIHPFANAGLLRPQAREDEVHVY